MLERLEKLERWESQRDGTSSRHACLASDDVESGHEDGNERRGSPLTPSSGNVFSCVTRDAWRIFHPDRGRVIATAPGNSFWSKERIPGVRDACGESRKGARKAREAFYPIARRCLFGRRA